MLASLVLAPSLLAVLLVTLPPLAALLVLPSVLLLSLLALAPLLPTLLPVLLLAVLSALALLLAASLPLALADPRRLEPRLVSQVLAVRVARPLLPAALLASLTLLLSPALLAAPLLLLPLPTVLVALLAALPVALAAVPPAAVLPAGLSVALFALASLRPSLVRVRVAHGYSNSGADPATAAGRRSSLPLATAAPLVNPPHRTPDGSAVTRRGPR